MTVKSVGQPVEKSIKEALQAMNRRQTLSFIGSVGAGVGVGMGLGLFSGCGSSSANASSDAATGAGTGGTLGTGATDAGALDCILTPEATEGPFFVDEKLNRSDLLAGQTDAGITTGYPLTLNLSFFGVNGQSCQPLPAAYVDIWQANVNGLYSDEPANFVQSTDTTGQNYLRGYQVTGGSGLVAFKTIYPGWYATRTIHIHIKVRLYSAAGDKTLEANSQLYFSDAMNDQVLAIPAYAARGPRSIPNNTHDQVYNGTGPGSGIDNVGLPPGQTPPGDLTIAAVTPFNPGTGSVSTLKVGVKLS